MRFLMLFMLVIVICLGCSETEDLESVYSGSAAPQANNQFRNAEHRTLSNQITALLNEVRDGNNEILNRVNPLAGECAKYASWAGDWKVNVPAGEEAEDGYRFRANGTFFNLFNWGNGWGISEGGTYSVCAESFEMTEPWLGAGRFLMETGSWRRRGNVMVLTWDNGEVETLTKMILQ